MLGWLLMCALPAKSEESLRVSVITCWPGRQVYELYGHTAIRITGETFDSVWNYGIFDFNEPNFVGRFVKGDLMYSVAGYPFAWFMPEYVWTGRHVEEQVLDLSGKESEALRHALQLNSLPQNRRYPYDYVKDNCSTRVNDKIEGVLTTGLSDVVAPHYPTYRAAMRSHHSHYPWYSMGIDITLGYPMDTVVNSRDLLFLPQELYAHLGRATRSDGRRIVKDTVVLNEGEGDATLPPTPWWLGPVWWGWVICALAGCYEALVVWRRGRVWKVPEALYFFAIGVTGSVIAYLVLMSSHAASRPNLLLMWFNPLAFLVPLLIWWRSTKKIVLAYMVANIFALLMLSIIWPFQLQSGNAAFVPLAITDILLATGYVVGFVKRTGNE